MLLLLSGCGTTQEIVYQTKFIGPPDALLIKCPVEPPPNMQVYLDSTWKQKEGLLTKAYDNQTNNVGVCNRRFGSLQDWKIKNEGIFETDKNGVKKDAARKDTQGNK